MIMDIETFICIRALEIDYRKEEALKRLQSFINDDTIYFCTIRISKI